MLSPTVIGVVLHRLGLKYNFGQVEVQRGEAELDFNLTEIVLHWSCTRWSTTDSSQVHRGQVEVQRGEAELDFNLAEMDLTEVARGGPALTPLKATESKSKFNEAQPSWTWTWTRWPWAEVARGGEQVHRGQVEVQRGEAELNFNLAEMYLFSSECNFSAMLTSWEASTPRRSRGVLVLPTSQHCRGVCGGSPSATPMQIWREGRQVHRGEAKVYLPFLRVKFAPSRWSPTPITVELNVSTLSAPPLQWVHWPIPLLQKVKSSMITEQNGILTPTPHPCPAVLVSPTTRVVPLPPQLLPLPTFLPLMATSTSSDPTSDSSSKSLIFHSSKIGPTISSDIADYVTLLSDV